MQEGRAADVRELLLSETLDKEEQIERKFTPLLLAAQEGRVECVVEVTISDERFGRGSLIVND